MLYVCAFGSFGSFVFCLTLLLFVRLFAGSLVCCLFGCLLTRLLACLFCCRSGVYMFGCFCSLLVSFVCLLVCLLVLFVRAFVCFVVCLFPCLSFARYCVCCC